MLNNKKTNEGHLMTFVSVTPGKNFCEVCNKLVWSDAYICDCIFFYINF